MAIRRHEVLSPRQNGDGDDDPDDPGEDAAAPSPVVTATVTVTTETAQATVPATSAPASETGTGSESYEYVSTAGAISTTPAAPASETATAAESDEYVSAAEATPTQTPASETEYYESTEVAPIATVTAQATATITSQVTSPPTIGIRPGGLDNGAKAGITVGVVVGAFFLGGLIYMCMRRYLQRRRGNKSAQGDLPSQKPEAAEPTTGSSPPKDDDVEQVMYKHIDGDASLSYPPSLPPSYPSPLSTIRPWFEARTVSTPSTEAEARAAYAFDGFQYSPPRELERAHSFQHREAEAWLSETPIWEVPDTYRYGRLSPVELPGSFPKREQHRPPAELASDKSLEEDKT